MSEQTAIISLHSIN